jgi:cell division protein FtsB
MEELKPEFDKLNNRIQELETEISQLKKNKDQ